jgi:hypothetical protein
VTPTLIDQSCGVRGVASAFWATFELATRAVGGDPIACRLARVVAREADVDDRRVGLEPVVVDLDWEVNPLCIAVGAGRTVRDVATIAKVGDWSHLDSAWLIRREALWSVVSWGSIRDARSRRRVRLRHFGPWSADHPRVYGYRPWPDDEAREWLRRFSNPGYVAYGVRGGPIRAAA